MDGRKARWRASTFSLALAIAGTALVTGCGGSSSETSASTEASGAPGSGASGTSGLAGAQPTGQVRILVQRPRTKDDAFGAKLLQAGKVPKFVQELAQGFKLPNPLTLRFANGIGPGPFYSPKDNSITDFYGFASEVFGVLHAANPSWSPRHVGGSTAAVDDFVVAHEFGHALIANYNLPVLGSQEDAADTIATITLLHLPPALGYRVTSDAARFWAAFSGRQSPPDLAEYADTHGFDLQRADNIICLTAGASMENFRRVAALGVLPASRLRSCRSEYVDAANSIQQELKPHLK